MNKVIKITNTFRRYPRESQKRVENTGSNVRKKERISNRKLSTRIYSPATASSKKSTKRMFRSQRVNRKTEYFGA
jgi:hypothetical protein